MFSKISLFTLSAFLLFSVDSTAKVVTENDAEDIVRNFMAAKGLGQKVLVPYHTTLDDALRERAPKRDGAPAYHLFRDTDNSGFIVVAGDDIARPILGYSFNINPDTDAEIPPAMQDWLDDIEKQILQARKNGLSQTTKVARQWSDPAAGNVVKQLNTAKWNQQYPYNLQCPIQNGQYCYTGCTSTAYAIIMKYYGYPSSGRGVTPAYTCSTSGIYVPSRDLNHTYDWDSMPNEYIFGQYTDQQAKSVARLMADIGAALQADYSNKETSAYYGKSAIFAHFGYNVGIRKIKSDYTSDQWSALLKNELDKNRPVLYSGASDQGLGSHAFLIDGYTDQNYFCVNWGWGGSYDGAYALDALELDFIDYRSEQAAYPDFRPADGLPAVAVVNDSFECPSLEAAVGMASFDGQPTRITMIQNSATDEVIIKNGQNVILDLNGYTIDLETYGIFNRGNLVITDTTNNGKMTVKKGNFGILNNYGNLTVEGGEMSNLMNLNSDIDYRRCIWSDAASTTVIKNGKFECKGQVICSNGKMTIDGGNFDGKDNNFVILNYCFTDTVVINGGNYVSSGKTSRVIWGNTGSATQIQGGTFTSKSEVIRSNGKMTVNGGQFTSTGNAGVIVSYANADTLTINGGTFKNTYKTKESTDYRRALWTCEESVTKITNGQFSCDNQVLTFNGTAVIDSATIDNTGSGIGILSHGKVTINYCQLSANTILSVNTGYTIKCYGGLYSRAVGASFIASGYKCVNNRSSTKYPFKVIKDNTAVEATLYDAGQTDIQYDLNGVVSTDDKPGIRIIRKADGKTIKVLKR